MQNARENAGTREGPGILRPPMVERETEEGGGGRRREKAAERKSNNPNPVGWGTKTLKLNYTLANKMLTKTPKDAQDHPKSTPCERTSVLRTYTKHTTRTEQQIAKQFYKFAVKRMMKELTTRQASKPVSIRTSQTPSL